MRRLVLTHFVASALLLWLCYYWLGIAETRASMLSWSIFVAVLILTLGCWVGGTGFAYFRDSPSPNLAAAFRTTLRNLLPLAVAVLAVGLVYWLLEILAVYSTKPALQLASYLTLKLHTPVRPSTVARVFSCMLRVIRWVLLPVILLPALSAITSAGWRGCLSAGSNLRNPLRWIATPILLFCTLRMPFLLLDWIPNAHGFGMEATSFMLRAMAAYLLFGCGWLVLAFVTAAGKPRLTQPSTAVSP